MTITHGGLQVPPVDQPARLWPDIGDRKFYKINKIYDPYISVQLRELVEIKNSKTSKYSTENIRDITVRI